MLKNIEAVIFDLDGTLVDSMWMWKQIDIDYLARYNIEFPNDLQKDIEGFSFTETAEYFKKRFNLPDTIDKIKSDWNDMTRDIYANKVPMKEGVMDFLNYLKSKKIPMGIATSNSRELAEIVLDKHNIKDYFDSIRTSCQVDKGKPYPDVYLQVAKDLQVEAEKCLVFEDVPQGIMAGKNANMKVCAVYDEHSKKDTEQKKRLAEYYIHSMKELSKYFD